MEVFIFGWWWTSHQYLAHKGLRILRFCIMSWKSERDTKVKHCMGRQIEVVQKFTKIQSFGQNWWWANGIRVENLPKIHNIGALHQSPRVTVKIELLSKLSVTPENSQDGLSSCRCSTTSHGDLKTIKKRMRVKCSTRFSLCEEIWSKTMVIPWPWSIIGVLESKGGGKLSIHYCADPGTIETVAHNCFCYSAQYLRSNRRNVWGMWNLSW